jgi:hypothetical protein
MEQSPTDVHAAPPAAATADTAMHMAKPPSPSIARATGIRVRQTATATGPERPDNQTLTPRTGGYRNPNPAPSLAHHATLTGRCLKPTVSRSSPIQHPALHTTPPLRVGVLSLQSAGPHIV